MGTPLWGTNFFSLAAFKILSLSLTFGILIIMCVGVGLFASVLFGDSVLPGFACLFPSPGQGSFILLLFQVDFQFLALSLLLVPL